MKKLESKQIKYYTIVKDYSNKSSKAAQQLPNYKIMSKTLQTN